MCLNGLSLLCHYTNRSAEKDRQSTEYLLALSKQRAILALPEEDTICINGAEIEVIGARPYYVSKTESESKEKFHRIREQWNQTNRSPPV